MQVFHKKDIKGSSLEKIFDNKVDKIVTYWWPDEEYKTLGYPACKHNGIVFYKPCPCCNNIKTNKINTIFIEHEDGYHPTEGGGSCFRVIKTEVVIEGSVIPLIREDIKIDKIKKKVILDKAKQVMGSDEKTVRYPTLDDYWSIKKQLENGDYSFLDDMLLIKNNMKKKGVSK